MVNEWEGNSREGVMSLNWITLSYIMCSAHAPPTESSSHLTSRSVMDPALVPKPSSIADM